MPRNAIHPPFLLPMTLAGCTMAAQCEAITVDGPRCTRSAKVDGLCKQHYVMQREGRLKERVAAAATSAPAAAAPPTPDAAERPAAEQRSSRSRSAAERAKQAQRPSGSSNAATIGSSGSTSGGEGSSGASGGAKPVCCAKTRSRRRCKNAAQAGGMCAMHDVMLRKGRRVQRVAAAASSTHAAAAPATPDGVKQPAQQQGSSSPGAGAATQHMPHTRAAAAADEAAEQQHASVVAVRGRPPPNARSAVLSALVTRHLSLHKGPIFWLPYCAPVTLNLPTFPPALIHSGMAAGRGPKRSCRPSRTHWWTARRPAWPASTAPPQTKAILPG